MRLVVIMDKVYVRVKDKFISIVFMGLVFRDGF